MNFDSSECLNPLSDLNVSYPSRTHLGMDF